MKKNKHDSNKIKNESLNKKTDDFDKHNTTNIKSVTSSRLYKFLKYVSFIIVIFLIAGELFFRIFYYTKLKTESYPLVYEPDSIIGYKYIPNSKSRISLPGIDKEIEINERGFPGPSFSEKKPNGKFRVAIVGNSNATGLWYEGKNDFIVQLKELLSKTNPEIEVINCSIDGRARGAADADLIAMHVIKFEPDLVLFNTDIPIQNIRSMRETYKQYVMMYPKGQNTQDCKQLVDEIESHNFLIFLYKISFNVRAFCRYYYMHEKGELANKINYFVTKRAPCGTASAYLYTYDETAKLLNRLKLFLHHYNCNLLLYFFDYKPKIKSFLSENKISSFYMDIPNNKEYISPIYGHFNENGHQAIANKFYNMIRDYYTKLKLSKNNEPFYYQESK